MRPEILRKEGGRERGREGRARFIFGVNGFGEREREGGGGGGGGRGKGRERERDLLAALCDLYNLCWSSASIPCAWKQAVVRLIPKSSASVSPDDPCNFRPIALTSCVGKVFTSILKNRWFPS